MERLLIWCGAGLVGFGLLVMGVGALLGLVGGRGLPHGRLPGDIVVSRPGFTFVFPLTTCLVLSVLLTLLLWAAGLWRR